LTILVATPYLTEAERCNKVALFNQGKLLRFDTAAAITTDTTLHVFEIITRNLKAAFEIVSGFEIAENVIVLGDRIDFLTKHELGDGPESIINAVRADIDPNASMRETSPSLDNVFASLIR
ncbi:MAG: ABC transporter ATP-binding protein, partial [Bacteroidetes bacterium]|nr:ABC transporter ATP-binding protein [Bacteroidota bacterium]